MKKWMGIWVAGVAAGMVAGASGAYVTDYQFNDAEGTQLQDLVNDGADINTFSWNNGDATTDGAGSLAITTGPYLGHELYGSPITNGIVTYELGISSWDLTAFSKTNSDKSPAMFEIGASGGTHTDRIRLGFKVDANSNVLIRSDGVYLQEDIELPTSSTDGIRFRQVVDLNNDTYSISYQRYSDGSYWTGWSSGTWGRGAIEGIKMMQGDGVWTTGDRISFDYLTVDTSNKIVYKGEDWQMDEADGTGLSGLRNLTGSASWSGDTSDVFTTNGVLRFTGGNTDQAYRESTVPSHSNGVFELKTRYSAADLGTLHSNTLGFGMKDSIAGENIFMLRLQNNEGTLILQYIIGNYESFGTLALLNGTDSVLTNALVAWAVADFDAGELTFHYDYGDGEVSSEAIPFVASNPTPLFDTIRMSANNSSTIWSPDAFVEVDYLVLTPILPPATPDGLYSEWLDGFAGMGAETNRTDNPDGDLLENLYEYALGGNPMVPDTGAESSFQTLEEGGTNWLEYVYAKRNDAPERGLEYYLETVPNLVTGTWTNDNYTVQGSGVLDDEFDTVTNRVPVDAENQQFIRLQVDYTP